MGQQFKTSSEALLFHPYLKAMPLSPGHKVQLKDSKQAVSCHQGLVIAKSLARSFGPPLHPTSLTDSTNPYLRGFLFAAVFSCC